KFTAFLEREEHQGRIVLRRRQRLLHRRVRHVDRNAARERESRPPLLRRRNRRQRKNERGDQKSAHLSPSSPRRITHCHPGRSAPGGGALLTRDPGDRAETVSSISWVPARAALGRDDTRLFGAALRFVDQVDSGNSLNLPALSSPRALAAPMRS